jgi:hypothetical protein
MYRGSPSIADRMRVLDFAASLRKADDMDSGSSGQMVSNPMPTSPPSSPMSSPPEMTGGGGPSPEEMSALVSSGKVYGGSKEALADFEMRLTELATDITAHIGTIGQSKYTEDLDGDSVMGHASSLMALRSQIEETRNFCEIIRLKDAGMVNHMPGMGGPMPPDMSAPPMGGLQNMPGPGPAGMPPGGMPMPGPMMGGM